MQLYLLFIITDSLEHTFIFIPFYIYRIIIFHFLGQNVSKQKIVHKIADNEDHEWSSTLATGSPNNYLRLKHNYGPGETTSF